VTSLADVRRIAGSLPETEEVLTWGTDVTFRVRGKIFAIGADDSHNLSVKATPATQAELIDLDPATFSVAAYVGRFGWVRVSLDRIGPTELGELLVEDWRLTAPKRLVATLDEPHGGGSQGATVSRTSPPFRRAADRWPSERR
jgi:hypothetical protein